MKKKLILSAITTGLMLVGTSLAAGCSLTKTDSGDGTSEPLDSSKTQLFVKNYQGGYGNKWLYAAAKRYEKLHANESYETGKTGVQIMISDQKQTPDFASIKNDSTHLYFFEGINYHNGVEQNAFEDITDIVTGANPYDTGNKTIESKMFAENKAYYNVSGKYYAVPHYASSFGIVYNKTVFRDKLLYFAKDYQSQTPGSELRFIASANAPKSVGVDGIEGTADDGLPSTYNEFYELCDYMVSGNVVPLVHMGKNGGGDYFPMLANSLAAAYHGSAEIHHNFDYNGQIKVAKMNEAGTEALVNGDGTLQTETVTVHPERVAGKYDGYETQRMAGKYYGLSFLRKIEDKRSTWVNNNVGPSSSHLDAQNWFINSQFGRNPSPISTQKNNPIAMILEGDWWESEASQSISELEASEKAQLDFGWMPLPKADSSSNTKPTLMLSESMSFVRPGLSKTIRDLAGDFIRYTTTDEALREFTTITNAAKCFEYDLTSADQAKLSNFGKDWISFFKSADKVFTGSHSEQYMKSVGSELITRRYNISNVLSYPQTVFANNPALTAKQYLGQMYSYYKNSVWDKI